MPRIRYSYRRQWVDGSWFDFTWEFGRKLCFCRPCDPPWWHELRLSFLESFHTDQKTRAACFWLGCVVAVELSVLIP